MVVASMDPVLALATPAVPSPPQVHGRCAMSYKCPEWGIETAYTNRGCRCDPCKEHNRKKIAKYRSTQRGKLNVLVRSRADAAALTVFRRMHPELWKEILDAQWERVGGKKHT